MDRKKHLQTLGRQISLIAASLAVATLANDEAAKAASLAIDVVKRIDTTLGTKTDFEALKANRKGEVAIASAIDNLTLAAQNAMSDRLTDARNCLVDLLSTNLAIPQGEQDDQEDVDHGGPDSSQGSTPAATDDTGGVAGTFLIPADFDQMKLKELVDFAKTVGVDVPANLKSKDEVRNFIIQENAKRS